MEMVNIEPELWALCAHGYVTASVRQRGIAKKSGGVVRIFKVAQILFTHKLYLPSYKDNILSTKELWWFVGRKDVRTKPLFETTTHNSRHIVAHYVYATLRALKWRRVALQGAKALTNWRVVAGEKMPSSV